MGVVESDVLPDTGPVAAIEGHIDMARKRREAYRGEATRCLIELLYVRSEESMRILYSNFE